MAPHAMIHPLLWLCACLLDILRVLLFIGCILLSSSQMANIYHAWIRSNYFMLVHYMHFNTFNVGPDTYLIFFLLAVAGLKGAHAAYSRTPKKLMIFAVIMMLWSVALLIAGQSCLVRIEDDENLFKTRLERHATSYTFNFSAKGEPNEATRVWDLIQSELQCCGVDDHTDWNIWTSERPKMIPKSCCAKQPPGTLSECSRDSHLLFNEGCGTKITRIFSAIPSECTISGLWYLSLALIALLLLTGPTNHTEGTSKGCELAEKIPTAPIAYL